MYQRFTLICLIGVLFTALTIPVASQEIPRPVINSANAGTVTLLAQTGSDHIIDVDWSPDNKLIGVLSQNSVALYKAAELNTPPRLLEMAPFDKAVCGPFRDFPCSGTIIFIDGGQTLVVATDVRVRVYDVATGVRKALYTSIREVGHMANHPGTDLLIAGSEAQDGGPMLMYDFATTSASVPTGPYPSPEYRSRWFQLNGGMRSAAFSPDGHFLAVSRVDLTYDNPDKEDLSGIELYDLETVFDDVGDENMIAPTQRIANSWFARQIAISPDSQLVAAAGTDQAIHLWTLADGAVSGSLEGHQAAVWDLAFSPKSDLLASTGWDATVRLWDLATRTQVRVIDGLQTAVTAVDFNAEGTQIIVGGWDGSLRIFDTATGEQQSQQASHWGTVWKLAFNLDGTQLAVGTEEGEIVFYDVLNQPLALHERYALKGHSGMIQGLTFHPDGTRLASSGTDGKIIIWDTETGLSTQTVQTEGPIYDVLYHPNGTTLLCATETGYGEVIADQCTEPETPFLESKAVLGLAYSGDGSRIALAQGDAIGIQKEGMPPLSFDLRPRQGYYPSFYTQVQFSVDGRTLLGSGPYLNAMLWNLESLTQVFFSGPAGLSPDGSLVANGSLNIYNATTTGLLFPPRNYNTETERDTAYEGGSFDLGANPRAVVFSPRGQLIAVANANGVISLWGIATANDLSAGGRP